MTSVFATFVSENLKVGKLRSDVSPAVDVNCIVLHLDVRQDRTNGFIRKHRSFLRWLSVCGPSVSSRHTVRWSQLYRHVVNEYEWIHFLSN
jgi:hypothetical protein